MRFVIFGAGAIGGVVGARLLQGGYEVVLIARGPHLEAIRESGLTLETPVVRAVLQLPAVRDPAELRLGAEDIVLLTTKSQDTAAALVALRRAAGSDLPLVCVQNGVENERLALRSFAQVYGAVVMSPTAHLRPGAVEAYGAVLSGIIDLGRYPSGVDARCETISGALRRSNFESRVQPDIMRFKYAKLILNLGNAVWALCGPDERSEDLVQRARAEARAALTAARINFGAGEVDDLEGRWERIGVRQIDGRERAGSSTWQSLARGTGAIETDYLNGEIVLLGRLHGVPTPVNAALCRLAERHAREGGRPGDVPVDAVMAASV